MKNFNFALLSIGSKNKVIKEAIEKSGHKIIFNGNIRDDKTDINYNFVNLLRDKRVNVIITTGGADFKSESCLIEIVKEKLEKDINVDALLKQLYYEKYKASALSFRSFGGVAKGKAIFCLPDDERAVKLAMDKLIIPGIESIFSQID